MVDPIGSFVTLIRSLSQKKADATAGTVAANPEKPAHSPAQAVRPTTELRGRLRRRLAAVGTGDRDRARRTFVETILLWQLGDELARDPSFGDLVVQVANQLGSDARIDADLDDLIAAIAA